MSDSQTNLNYYPYSLQAKLSLSLIIWLVGCVLLWWPLLGSDPSETLWADDFDSNLLRWIAEWGYYALAQKNSLELFWNANSFFPEKLTLAYSDSLLSAQLFYTPLRLLGFEPLTALYSTLACLLALGISFTVFGLARLKSFSSLEIGFIAFIAHFGLSITNFLGHYQLFGFELVPAFLIYLFLFIRTLSGKDLLITTFLLVMAIGCSIYLAPILAVLTAIFCLPALFVRIYDRTNLRELKKIGIFYPVLSIVLLSLLFKFQLIPYFEVAKLFPLQSYEESSVYSATISSFFDLSSVNSVWYGAEQYSNYGDWERAYAPGILSLCLLVIGAIWFCLVGRKSFSLNNEQTVLACSLFLVLISSYLFSLGPSYGAEKLKLPFWYISELMPSFRSIRAPGRFGMLLTLPIGFLVVVTIKALTINLKKRELLTAAALIAVIIEAIPNFRIAPYSAPKTDVYQQVAQLIPELEPLLELPLAGSDHISTIRIIMEQLNGSTIHHARMASGYGGKSTETYQKFLNLDQQFKAGNIQFQETLYAANSVGIKNFLVHFDRYPQQTADSLKLQLNNLELLWQADSSALYRISAK